MFPCLSKETIKSQNNKYVNIDNQPFRSGFKVDQDTGIITTNGVLDREETESYFLTLMAQDCSATEPRATAVNLTITVLDENDNSPVFSLPKFEVSVFV